MQPRFKLNNLASQIIRASGRYISIGNLRAGVRNFDGDGFGARVYYFACQPERGPKTKIIAT